MYSASSIFGLIELAYFGIFSSVAFIVWKNTKHPWARALGTLFVIGIGLAYPVKIALERKEVRDTRAAAEAHFRKMCETKAGEWIYRTEKDVDGFLLMKPRQLATTSELQDQFWMGDPYGYSPLETTPTVYLTGVLPYLYVDVPLDGESGFRNGYRRITLDRSVSPSRVKDAADPKTPSRFGFTWSDVSTESDRAHWVAAGEMTVVDLDSQQVIARRIGFVFESGMGYRGAERNSWSDASRAPQNLCPSFPTSAHKSRDFLSRVLVPRGSSK